MIVDASAVLAALLGEPEREAFIESLTGSARSRLSAAGYLELGIVVDGRHNPLLSRRRDEALEQLGIEIVPVTPEQARIARHGYRDFGRGSGHPGHGVHLLLRARQHGGLCGGCGLQLGRLGRAPPRDVHGGRLP